MTITIDNGNPTPLSAGDRWTPIRNGETFCSPACGAKCTYAQFEQASAGAAALVAALGEGWQPTVWENGTWHYEARKGSATVNYREDTGTFEAELQATRANGQVSQFIAKGNSPRAAMEAVLALADEEISLLKRARTSASLEPLAITFNR
jgi:hypothetical protein